VIYFHKKLKQIGILLFFIAFQTVDLFRPLASWRFSQRNGSFLVAMQNMADTIAVQEA